jgi:proteasome lid subunit RPN8/RPN11
MFETLKQEMKAHALSRPEEEVCGLIVEGKYIPCDNIHSSPSLNFAISASDYARASEIGEIEGVFHSHPGLVGGFSPHDIQACKASNLPWVALAVGFNQWHEMSPCGDAPYLQRPWIYGIYDCYGLFRDFYRNEFGILLNDFDRGDQFEWESPEWRMFEKNVEAQGFVEIDRLEKKGDMILMQLQCNFVNHIGVLARPEANVFYHHLLDRLSEENIYGGYWAQRTRRLMRHKELF